MSPLPRERRLFALALLFCLLLLFYPHYLPLVDLPQHASQVVLLNDLWLHGNSRWGEMLQINWNTPYLVLYLYWLGLYQCFDILLSAKILLATILLLYVWAFARFRRAYDAPVLVDWVALGTFFGLAFQFGFLSFLLALPFGLLFVLLSRALVARLDSLHPALLIGSLLPAGLFLYLNHVLIYALACLLAYGSFLIELRRRALANRPVLRPFLLYSASYLIFALLLLYFLFKPDVTGFQFYQRTEFHPWGPKTLALLYLPWNQTALPGYDFFTLALYLLPPALGYRPSRDPQRHWPLLAVLAVYYLLPFIGFEVTQIYSRFALLIPPFYYLIWTPGPALAAPSGYLRWAHGFFVLCASALLLKFANNQIRFEHATATREFRQILAQLKPGQRLLTVFELGTRSAPESKLTSALEYLYFGNWYQAERGGWSDFNFASLYPQVVRFKPGRTPAKRAVTAELQPENFQAITRCQDYDYLLVRTRLMNIDTIEGHIHSNPDCGRFRFATHAGYWLLFTPQN